jgi:photosystem II stability/assembly factor-like uncharacterized protein
MIFAINFNKVYAQWEKIYDSIRVYWIVADNNNIIFQGTLTKMYLSTDNGNNWEGRFQNIVINGLFIKNNTILFHDYDSYFLMRSTDLGISWDTITNKNGYKIPSSVLDWTCKDDIDVFSWYKNIYYIGSCALYTSTDDGINWKAMNLDSHGTTEPYTPSPPKSIAFKDSVIYAVDWTEKMYVSTDSCKTWKVISNVSQTGGGRYVWIVTSGQNLIVLVNTPKNWNLFLSSDVGKNWHNITYTSCRADNIITIASCGDNVYVVSDSGIFVTTDYGNNWKIVSYPIFGTPGSYRLAFNNEYMFLGTANGVYRVKLKDCIIDTTAVSVSESPPQQYITISPNPAGAVLYITAQPPPEGYPVRIYSLQGIKLIETEFRNQIDISSLATGIYFVQVGNKFMKFVKM